MAEFLTTTGVSHHLERLIEDAGKWLVFVSPFLKTNPVIRQHLTLKFEKSFPTWLVFGKAELNKGEDAWWKQYPCVQMGFLDNLHAKCYLSEAAAVVTSMNLYDFSQQNNNEMGFLLTREKDKDLYESVVKYAGKMIAFSDATKEAKAQWETLLTPVSSPQVNRGVVLPAGFTVGARPKQGEWVVQQPKPAPKKRLGYCIRCKEEIKPDNWEWPYCREHNASWKDWGNENYVEKYCYACGRPYDSIRLKPLCDKCFRLSNQGVDIFAK